MKIQVGIFSIVDDYPKKQILNSAIPQMCPSCKMKNTESMCKPEIRKHKPIKIFVEMLNSFGISIGGKILVNREFSKCLGNQH